MQLVSRVFDIEGCKRSVYSTHNQGVAPAIKLEHMGDEVCVCMCVCFIKEPPVYIPQEKILVRS